MYAQKRIVKSIDNPAIHTLKLDANQIFTIRIDTHNSSTFNIEAQVSGQHNEQIVLRTNEQNNVLEIEAKFQPLFQPFYDKLSAHKVISIDLVLTIPKNLNVFITSDIASVIATGWYSNLNVNLETGAFNSFRFKGNADINTLKGNIYAELKDTNVETHTRNGSKYLADISGLYHTFKANSIDGDIIIKNATE